MATFENYAALMYAVQNQLDDPNGGVDPSDSHPADPANLLSHHIDLLVDLHDALELRKTKPNEALAAWKKLLPALKTEFTAAKAAEMDPKVITALVNKLVDANENLFVASAYQQAAGAHKGQTEVPDAEVQKEKLEKAEKEFLEAQKLWEGVRNVAAAHVQAVIGEEGDVEIKDIIELVELPGTIEEKLEWAKRKGVLTQLGTAVELVGKVKGACATLIKTASTIGRRYCEGLLKQALAQSKKELAKELGEAIERWKAVGEVAETLGNVASAIAVIGDGLELLDAIRSGDWDAALSKTEDLVEDAAPLALGADAAAPVAGIVILAKAEMQAWHDAAAFIRYCKDEQVREAAEKFAEALTERVYPWADKLNTNVEIMLDPTVSADVQQKAQAQVDYDAKNTWDAFKWVAATYLGSSESWQLGHYDAAYQALGSEAIAAMNDLEFPAETNEGVIAFTVLDKVQKVFHGANLMAHYVGEHYKN